jgi:hypothetical protein
MGAAACGAALTVIVGLVKSLRQRHR